MVSDLRAAAARRHHSDAERAVERAAEHRRRRDALVRELRADDPARWTYPALAAAVGCSPELIAYIVKAPTRT